MRSEGVEATSSAYGHSHFAQHGLLSSVQYMNKLLEPLKAADVVVSDMVALLRAIVNLKAACAARSSRPQTRPSTYGGDLHPRVERHWQLRRQ